MSYLRPFLSAFGVCLLILVLQFLSRYKSDLIGKGLGLGQVLEIFGYASISLIVLAMPVAVLLSSLFTMGNFGEHYELAAMRSAGMSVPRILRPMFLATVVISMVSFVLSSYVVPWANLGLYMAIYDVQQLKPVFQLEAGHFNSGVDNYVIHIEGKDVSKDMLYGVRIYDHTHAPGDTTAVQFINKGRPDQYAIINDSSSRNGKFVYADSGTVRIDPYGRYLNMKLYGGASYETRRSFNKRRMRVENFAQIAFDSLYYSFDMKGYASEASKEEDFASHQYMLNLTELNNAADSILEVRGQLVEHLESALASQLRIDSTVMRFDTVTDAVPPDNFILKFPRVHRATILKNAITMVAGGSRIAQRAAPMIDTETLRIRERRIEFHGKFSLPLACMIFLFIGAPLGAIIRKGGVGLPIVVSLVLYLAFYVLMIQGKKMAAEGVVSPFVGAWLPIFVMAPMAFMLSLESASGLQMFSSDNIWRKTRWLLRAFILINPLYWLYRIPFVGRVVDAVLARFFKRRETERTFRVRR